MSKIAAFFEGGIPYDTLKAMPLEEFFGVVSDANEIAVQRKAEAERAKNG